MRGYRVGIVGPRAPFGQAVRALLSEGELPTTELKLFASDVSGGAAISQFRDEVVVTQPIDPDLFPHLDVAFFAGEDSDLMNRLAHQAAEEGVLSLIEGAVGLGAPVVTPRDYESLTTGNERLAIIPRVASYLVGETLRTVSGRYELDRAVATVLVPAQLHGDSGVDELHQQFVQILNFRNPPVEVFREQLAFNVKLAGATSASDLAITNVVAWEASQIARLSDVLTVSLVQVPVFHGYSAAIWIETKDPVEARAFQARFRAEPFESPKSSRGAKAPSPVSVAGSENIHVGPVRSIQGGGPRGFWIWAVVDTPAYDPASAAVAIARDVLSST